MPVARYQLEDGRIARFQVPGGTTPEQAQQIGTDFFAQQQADPVTPPVQQQSILDELLAAGVSPDAAAREAPRLEAERSRAKTGGQIAAGLHEAAATIATGVVAEPISGLAGLSAAALNIIPGVDVGRPGDVVKSTREALTFKPRTEAGKVSLGAVAGILEPVGAGLESIESTLGDTVLSATGSPALAAAAKTLPTAIFEGLGLGVAAKAGKVSKKLPRRPTINAKQVENALIESAPNIDQLKDASRAVYKELDGLGVKFRKTETRKLKNSLLLTAKKSKFKPTLTPKTSAILDDVINELSGKVPLKVTDIENIRRDISKRAASSIDPTDSSAALELIDDIDLFFDQTDPKSFLGKPKGDLSDVSGRYSTARNLWGRARRSEIIADAFERADRQATGLENGIRAQLRQIVNNRKKSRFFTKNEISAMDEVIKGTTQQNVLKLVGRLGFSEGQATNILGGLGGLALGGQLGGRAGAAAVGAIGQIARKLAQRSTVRSAKLSDAIVRAGKDGKEVVKAYLTLTPKKQRDAFELSELLLDTDTTELVKSANKFTKEAAEIAKGRRALTQAQTAAVAAPLIPEQAAGEQ